MEDARCGVRGHDARTRGITHAGARRWGGSQRSAVGGRGRAVRLRVMTFNIEYGGTVVDLEKVLTAVRRSDADVVAFNEVYGKAGRLGRLTGHDHVSRRLDIVSAIR